MVEILILLAQIEDEMFKGFSESFGIVSIREYEEKVLKQQQQRTERKRKLDNHMAKLHAQVSTCTMLF